MALRLWARSPERKEKAKVCTIDFTIAVDVGLRKDRVDRSPEREYGTKIRAVNDLVVGDVGVLALWLFADIRDAVGVGVGELAGEDLAVVDDAVVVAVGGPFGDESTRKVDNKPVVPAIERTRAADPRPDAQNQVGAIAIIGSSGIPREVRNRLTCEPCPLR